MALDLGEKTEADLLKEFEAKESEEQNKLKELADNYKIRAEKAEAKAKEGKETAPKTEMSLSQPDLIALVKGDVAEEDIDDVADYAKFKNISVKEALKSSVVKSMLAERKEERATAEATQTGAKRKGTSAASGDELLQRAEQGKVPETKEEIAALVDARFKSKANRK